MSYLLFTVYLIVLCWLLLKVPYLKNAGVNGKLLLALFILKVLAGIAIGWVAIHIYGPGNDYWDVHDFALEEYHLLFNDPGRYLRNLFTSDYADGYAGLFSAEDSYWNDLRGNILIKIVSVFNIFSGGNYYINSLFFNFIIFFGHVTLYRLFITIFPRKQRLVIIGCFLLPSTLYFSSGIHKDGLVFLLLAMLIYSFYQAFLKNRFSARRVSMILAGMVLLFLIRSFVVLALLPALVAWTVAVKTKWPKSVVFAFVYILAGLLVFNVSTVVSSVKPLEIIISKQTAYLGLTGSDTRLELTRLEPTFRSFATNAPEALNHSLLRPYLWELPTKTLLPFCVELFAYQAMLLLFVFFRTREPAWNGLNQGFLFFAVFFILSVFLIIGYITPNLGSLVRYRSLYLPLIVTPLFCGIDWKKVKHLIRITK